MFVDGTEKIYKWGENVRQDTLRMKEECLPTDDNGVNLEKSFSKEKENPHHF